MVTRCYLCGGKTELKTVTAENWWGEKLILVENVPAWVCQDCGEQYFDAGVCQQLDQLRQSPPATRRTVRVPVYSFPAKSPAASGNSEE
ncbi:MAG: type II toxin-antitoxin system MqsA family antitoxin [SAR202 cluster bacterium]|nr:type II toxin-antitoxin system MqsA family antitoxin [SAR202 cluster bacterium]